MVEKPQLSRLPIRANKCTRTPPPQAKADRTPNGLRSIRDARSAETISALPQDSLLLLGVPRGIPAAADRR
jgi:hypothetical protein